MARYDLALNLEQY